MNPVTFISKYSVNKSYPLQPSALICAHLLFIEYAQKTLVKQIVISEPQF